jgi:hypothetical protein
MKTYLKNHTAGLTIILFLLVFIGGYTFFFSSKVFVPPSLTSKENVTIPGQTTEYQEGRTYSLISSEYSEEDRCMELLLEVSNQTSDGVNEYYYSADLIGGKVQGIEIKEIYSTPIITVIRIENLKKFDEMLFLLAPKTKEMDKISSSETAVLTLNKYNIKPVETIKDKTEYEYQIDRLNVLIVKYENGKNVLKKRVDDLTKNKVALLEENEKLGEELSLLLPEERQSAEQKIEINIEAVTKIEDEIAERNASVKAMTERIGIAESLMRELQNK